MAHDPFLSPPKGQQGISLAQREFRRREIVRGVVAVFIGLVAVAGLTLFFGIGPLAGNPSVGRGTMPLPGASAKPRPKPSQPGTLSISDQLLAPPSPRGRNSIEAPFVVPQGQVHRPTVRQEYGAPPPRLNLPPYAPPQHRPPHHPRPVPRVTRPQGPLVPVAPQQRGDALDPPEAPMETTP